MDYEDEELMEEKSFKAGGGEDDNPLLDDDMHDDLGPGPDEDFNPDEEEAADDFGTSENY